MATLRFDFADEDEEERKRREARLSAMRAAGGAFGSKKAEEDNDAESVPAVTEAATALDDTLYSNFELLAKDMAEHLGAEPLDGRLAQFEIRHDVLPAHENATSPVITVHFGEMTDIMVTNAVVASSEPVDGAEEAFAMACLARSVDQNRPVEITDCKSDYEMILVYYALKDAGVEVKNAREINSKIRDADPSVKAQKDDARKAWDAFKASDVYKNEAAATQAAQKLKEATMAMDTDFGGSATGVESARAPADTRQAFNKPIGMIAGEFVKHDNDAAEAVKAEYYALLQAEDRLDEGDLPKNRFGELEAFGLRPDKRAELLAKAGVTNEEMDAARAEVAKADFSGEGMPLYGDILVANGFVDRDVKNTLLAGQAAIRTLDIVDRVAAGDARVPEREFDFSKFGAFDDGDVDLTNAQLVHRAAYGKELDVANGNDDFPKVEGFKASALDSLEKAAAKLENLGQPEAARALAAVADSYKAPEQVAAAAPAAPGAKATG